MKYDGPIATCDRCGRSGHMRPDADPADDHVLPPGWAVITVLRLPPAEVREAEAQAEAARRLDAQIAQLSPKAAAEVGEALKDPQARNAAIAAIAVQLMATGEDEPEPAETIYHLCPACSDVVNILERLEA